MLVGGAGRDRIKGGAGNDAFVFETSGEGRDDISDFHGSLGDDDAFRIEVGGCGGGLATGGALAASRFRSRADNHAQDADDRFVFRTTEATLWFDVDGTGAAKAVMLADLQAGAVVTAEDILPCNRGKAAAAARLRRGQPSRRRAGS